MPGEWPLSIGKWKPFPYFHIVKEVVFFRDRLLVRARSTPLTEVRRGRRVTGEGHAGSLSVER